MSVNLKKKIYFLHILPQINKFSFVFVSRVHTFILRFKNPKEYLTVEHTKDGYRNMHNCVIHTAIKRWREKDI